ncbi:putative vacuolar protein sorting-associated protein [Chloropicon primus]|uniref:Putative vacuolar protein sorting-associated protein n=1 Tax=Chloropicon primus TaxID=1764295 RepID=A0A5B8MSG4_9CHLO|nr:putative vacuolar protein sorting-associated protein [Chloropicon primus]UPR02410.1 putative vacuolar protein sorting-associated protein [Chloropicon primus]|mmetsp:Transcript_14223/g.40357  ORF Transcript_14223/g.40357 Transcript_14223/m.40357 type:complete len:217 (+) Transcript_14223:186-836(+)|eukprot:QDZ23197.1 putative vacuolar protein sorting-associated protein [Chloropicon primus]
MGSAFSKKKSTKAQPSEVDKAILSLKTQKRKLTEYQKQVTVKIAAAQEQAQRCVREKNKTRAMFNLKQKKIFQVRLQEIDQYLMNVEETLCNIDTARQNNKVFETLKAGNEALKTIQSKVSISALQDLVADTEQAKEHEQQVNMILESESIDMSEVEGDLTLLEAEVLGESAAADDLPDLPDLPDVPKNLPVAKEEESKGTGEPVASRTAEEPMLA